MTPDEINIAIAEACGWTEIRPSIYGISRHQGYPLGQKHFTKEIPDYCGDLNAMHEVEETLKPAHEQYAFELAQLLGLNEEGELSFWDMWKVSHATAPQRAEAFLRTIGKWRDNQ